MHFSQFLATKDIQLTRIPTIFANLLQGLCTPCVLIERGKKHVHPNTTWTKCYLQLDIDCRLYEEVISSEKYALLPTNSLCNVSVQSFE